MNMRNQPRFNLESGYFRHPGRTVENLDVNGSGHRFITCGARVKVVAGVAVLAQSTSMVRIADGSIEIDHTVKGSAGANPLIDFLAGSFSVNRVVISALIGRERGAEHPDSVLVCAFDDLRETRDEIL